MIRLSALIGLGLLLMAAPARAGDFLIWCDAEPPGTVATYQAGDPQVAAHRRFTLPALHYQGLTTDAGGFNLTLLIDKTGKPTCALGIGDEDGDRHITTSSPMDRIRLLRDAVRWRYIPFLADGKPAAAVVVEHIDEVVDAPHIPMPQGRLNDTSIQLERTSGMGFSPAYVVALRGTGEAVLTAKAYGDITGTVRYTVPPGEVAALIERLRSADLWSMRDRYAALASDGAVYTLTMTVGGRTKKIVDYIGGLAGMPEVVTTMQDDIDATARAGDLIHLSPAGLNLLDGGAFPFKSARGAQLLMRAILDDEVPDATIDGLLDRGAPIRGGAWPELRHDAQDLRQVLPAFDAALRTGREGAAKRMIAMGALPATGKPDPVRLDYAFRSAITGGRIALVETLWNAAPEARPDLMFDYHYFADGEDQPPVRRPVTLLLLRSGYTNDKWQDIDVAGFLIGLGCDINAAAPDGTTLLFSAAGNGKVDYVRWLIAHGARIDVTNTDGQTPLSQALDEETALVLLEAGADPNVKPEYGQTFMFYVQYYSWTRVVDWLKAHGYEAQLKAEAPDAE